MTKMPVFTSTKLRWAILLAVGTLANVQLAAAARAAELPPLRSSGSYQVASSGHIFIDNGINAGKKVGNYLLDPDQLTDREVRILAGLGFNEVRLHFPWKLLEPCKRGTTGCPTYNEQGLTRLEAIVRQLADRGIYTQLDLHQDVWTDERNLSCRFFGIPTATDFYGNGAPRWATLNDNRCNGPRFSPWGAMYFYPGVIAAFNNFFNPNRDRRDIQQHYYDLWRHIATRFRNLTSVSSYDLFNEPSAGTILPAEMQRYERDRMQPIFERAMRAIRSVDRVHTIFFPHNITGDFGPPFEMSPGYDPQDEENNRALAVHVYCLLPPSQPICDRTQADSMALKKREVTERGIPGVVNEFGADDNPDVLGYLGDLADTNAFGRLYWQFKGLGGEGTGQQGEGLFTDDGVLKQAKAAALARVIPRLIAADDPAESDDLPEWCFTRRVVEDGRTSLCENQDEGHFYLRYNANRPGEVTTVFVPVQVPLDEQYKVYPNGYRVANIQGASVVSEPNAPLLRIENTTSDEVTLELEPQPGG